MEAHIALDNYLLPAVDREDVDSPERVAIFLAVIQVCPDLVGDGCRDPVDSTWTVRREQVSSESSMSCHNKAVYVPQTCPDSSGSSCQSWIAIEAQWLSALYSAKRQPSQARRPHSPADVRPSPPRGPTSQLRRVSSSSSTEHA